MDEVTSPEELSGNLKGGKRKEAVETASVALDQINRTANAIGDRLKSKMRGLDSAEIYVREKPLLALLVTFGIGLITGLLCRK